MKEPITGDKELDRLLYQMGEKSVRKIARIPLGKGLTVVARAIRREVPAATTAGHKNKRIKQAIGKRNKKNRRKGYHEAKAGIHVGKKKGAPHAHLLALGTKERFSGKRGVVVRDAKVHRKGRVKPNDFVKRGLQNADSEAMKRIEESFHEEFEKEVRRLRLRGGA